MTALDLSAISPAHLATFITDFCDDAEEVWKDLATRNEQDEEVVKAIRKAYERIESLHNQSREAYQQVHPGKNVPEDIALRN